MRGRTMVGLAMVIAFMPINSYLWVWLIEVMSGREFTTVFVATVMMPLFVIGLLMGFSGRLRTKVDSASEEE
jgi:hypothetical protein